MQKTMPLIRRTSSLHANIVWLGEGKLLTCSFRQAAEMDFTLDVDGEESIVGAGCTLEGLSPSLTVRDLVRLLESKLEKPSRLFVPCMSKEERERLGPPSITLEELGILESKSIYVRYPEGTVLSHTFLHIPCNVRATTWLGCGFDVNIRLAGGCGIGAQGGFRTRNLQRERY
jgi:hypothetical protein